MKWIQVRHVHRDNQTCLRISKCASINGRFHWNRILHSKRNVQNTVYVHNLFLVPNIYTYIVCLCVQKRCEKWFIYWKSKCIDTMYIFLKFVSRLKYANGSFILKRIDYENAAILHWRATQTFNWLMLWRRCEAIDDSTKFYTKLISINYSYLTAL